MGAFIVRRAKLRLFIKNGMLDTIMIFIIVASLPRLEISESEGTGVEMKMASLITIVGGAGAPSLQRTL